MQLLIVVMSTECIISKEKLENTIYLSKEDHVFHLRVRLDQLHSKLAGHTFTSKQEKSCISKH